MTTPINDLPELGVGVVWFAGLDHLIEASTDLVDFYEVEPATVSALPGVDTVAHPDGPLALLKSRHKPVVVHGVSCPVGGTIPPGSADISALGRAGDLVDSPWISEHLSIDRLLTDTGAVVPTGFFLPPAQSLQAVEVAAARLQRLKCVTNRPVAFETGVNYLRPVPGELTDGEFFAAIAEAADCYILCDLHNLWCNQHNGRQPVMDVMDELPLDRICEIHLAGGQKHDDFLLDAHSNLVDPELDAMAMDVIEKLPAVRAITFELIPDYAGPNRIDAAAYRRQLQALCSLWACRGRRLSGRRVRAGHRGNTPHEGWQPAAWERALGSAIDGRDSPIAGDPGIEIYKHLIATIRAGAVVTAMPLSYRLLALSLGAASAEGVLERYRSSTPPSAWARDEARAFGAFLKENVTSVPHLDEVVDFELAAQEALMTGQARCVQFTCDPHALLDPLRQGARPPSELPQKVFDVLVDPR